MYVTSRQGYKPPVKSTGRGKKYSHFASLKYCNGAETCYTYDPQRGKAGGQMAHANTYGTDTGKKYVVFIKVFNMKYIITFAMCLFLMCSCDNQRVKRIGDRCGNKNRKTFSYKNHKGRSKPLFALPFACIGNCAEIMNFIMRTHPLHFTSSST